MNARADFSVTEIDARARAVASIAGRIAGGLLSNPEQVAIRGFEHETASAAVRLADILVSMADAGGRVSVGEMGQHARQRLNVAGDVAAGIVANPEQLAMPSWEARTARAAWVVAGQICDLAVSGGVLRVR